MWHVNWVHGPKVTTLHWIFVWHTITSINKMLFRITLIFHKWGAILTFCCFFQFQITDIARIWVKNGFQVHKSHLILDAWDRPLTKMDVKMGHENYSQQSQNYKLSHSRTSDKLTANRSVTYDAKQNGVFCMIVWHAEHRSPAASDHIPVTDCK